MGHTINDQLLSALNEFITARFGLHFPRKRWRDLLRGVSAAAGDFGFADPASCIRWLITAPLSRSQLDTLISHLTIGETYFFREQKSFDALETTILPALISARREQERRLRIWSAGCSTGEEAYSVAILLHRLLPDLGRWKITILATDVNSFSLHKAGLATYGDWSFRGVAAGMRERYFRKSSKGAHLLADPIRKMVTLANLNLAQDPYPALSNNTNAMDIILCRNVLMYFSAAQAKKVVEGFRHALVPGGWLVVSPCETSHLLFRPFTAVTLNGALFYRKEERDRTTAALPCPAIPPLDSIPPLDTTTLSPAADQGLTPPPAPVPEQRKETPRPPAEPAVTPFARAEALYRDGEYGAAAAILTGSQPSVSPDTPAPSGESALLAARSFANQGNLVAALEWSEKAAACDRLNPQPYYLQATIFQEQGADEAAIVSLKKAIYADQGFVLAHIALANLAMRRRKMKEAVRHLENAASLLRAYGDDDILPGSEGMSARRLAEIITTTKESLG